MCVGLHAAQACNLASLCLPLLASLPHGVFCVACLLVQVAAGASLRELSSRSSELSLGSVQRCDSLSQLLAAALLPGCTALHILGCGPSQLELTLQGCTPLCAMRHLCVKQMKCVSLDAAVLPALESFHANHSCGAVSMGPAPFAALRSLHLEHTSASLDPALVPQLQLLILGAHLDLGLLGASTFPALTRLHFSQGAVALLSELLQRAPALAQLTLSLPWGSKPPLAGDHLQVGLRVSNPAVLLASNCLSQLVGCVWVLRAHSLTAALSSCLSAFQFGLQALAACTDTLTKLSLSGRRRASAPNSQRPLPGFAGGAEHCLEPGAPATCTCRLHPAALPGPKPEHRPQDFIGRR